MKALCTWLLCLCTCSVFAQSSLPPFAPVTEADVKNKVCTLDSTAEAYSMIDYGNAWVYEANDGYEIAYQYFVRIKILKKTAYDRATITVALHKQKNSDGGRLDRIEEIKGTTYNWENGYLATVSLGAKDVFTTKNESFDKVSFTLPQVREGSVIEYTFTIRSPFPFKPKDWFFQSDIPSLRSEYKFSYPTNLAYHIIQQACEMGFTSSNCERASSFNSCYWVMENIPAMKKEDFVSSPQDFYRMLHFELSEYIVKGMDRPKTLSLTWDDLDKQLLEDEDLGKSIHKIGAFDDLAEDFKKKYTDTLELAKAVYKFVQQNFSWNENIRLYTQKSLKQVYEQRQGNSAELNLLLISLLRQVGLPANPVIISTRGNGVVWLDFPLVTRFNYTLGVITIKGKNVFFDATKKSLKWGMLPAYCMSGQGRVLLPKKASKWIPITTPEKSITLTNIECSLGKEEGNLQVNAQLSGNGYRAINMIDKMQELGKEKYTKEIKSKLKKALNPTIQFEGFVPDSSEAVPSIAISMTFTEAYNQMQDRIYLPALLMEGVSQTPFPNPARTLPVDFTYPKDEIVTMHYNIPENYTVEEIPKNIRVALPNDGGRFLFSANIGEGFVSVTSQIQFKKSFYAVEEYEALRKFYDQIIAKHAEQIILKKK